MFRVAKLTDYAVVMLAEMAAGSAMVSAAQLARKIALPEPTAAKILKKLAGHNIVSSTRGANGGYRLAVAPDQLPLIRIITAIEGPVSLVSCADNSNEICERARFCNVSGRWNKVNSAIEKVLADVTLADMMPPRSGNAAGRGQMPAQEKVKKVA